MIHKLPVLRFGPKYLLTPPGICTFIPMGKRLYRVAVDVGDHLQTHNLKIVTAESCTGGWVAKALTDVPGSSEWFERGFVTYSNDAKVETLGVAPLTLHVYGAVSEKTVREMAEGALRHSQAHLAVSVSGIAGPEGGSVQKPVGTVWFAWARVGSATRAASHQFRGDRKAVRRQSVLVALQGVLGID